MPDFKPITLNDKDRIEYYLSINQYPNSEYSFGSLFAWQKSYNIQYAIIENCLCIINKSAGKHYAHFPLGQDEDFMKAFDALSDYFARNNMDFSFQSLSEPMITRLKEHDLESSFEAAAQRDFYDYVYKREKLVSLSGKKLQGKRNHYNYFVNNYDFELKGIDHTNEIECEERFADFILGKSKDPENELEATIKVLRHRDQLGLTGKTLYANGVLVGIILGGKHHDMGLLHIAKSDVEYRGASVALFKHFLEDTLTDCTYVNLMEDLGIEGLRKSKLAYRPDFMVEKSTYNYTHCCAFACKK